MAAFDHSLDHSLDEPREGDGRELISFVDGGFLGFLVDREDDEQLYGWPLDAHNRPTDVWLGREDLDRPPQAVRRARRQVRAAPLSQRRASSVFAASRRSAPVSSTSTAAWIGLACNSDPE